MEAQKERLRGLLQVARATAIGEGAAVRIQVAVRLQAN